MIGKRMLGIAGLVLVSGLACGGKADSTGVTIDWTSACIQFINATGDANGLNGSNVVWTISDRNGDPLRDLNAGVNTKVSSITQVFSVTSQAKRFSLEGRPPFTFSAGPQAGITGNLSCQASPSEHQIVSSDFWNVEARRSGVTCSRHPEQTILNVNCA